MYFGTKGSKFFLSYSCLRYSIQQYQITNFCWHFALNVYKKVKLKKPQNNSLGNPCLFELLCRLLIFQIQYKFFLYKKFNQFI